MADICYISSDEESSEEINGGGAGGAGSGDEYDWIRGLMDDGYVPGPPDDDSDDVVFVREIILNPKQNSVKVIHNNDDDCVILDEDPDKPTVEVGNDKGNGDSDDLLVVGEKGQVACRDFPHARHLCAKFPFASTPHESHCELCHCYVCDSLAPCVFWGNSISSISHCHATDKDEFWNTQRKSTKESDKVQPVVRSITGAALSVGSSVGNQPSLPPQLVGPILSCSTPSNLGTPDSGYTFSRSKFDDRLVSQPLCSAYNVNNPSNRRQDAGQIGTRTLLSGTTFKRSGSVRQASAASRLGYSSQKHHGSQFPRNLPLCPTLNLQSCQPNINCSLLNPLLESTSANYVSSGPHVSSQSHADSVPSLSPCGANSVYPQPQVAYQPYVGSAYGNNFLSKTQPSSQLNVSGALINSVPCNSPLLSQPYPECNAENIVASRPLEVNHQNSGNNFENQIHHDELTYIPLGDNFFGNPTQLAFQPNGATSVSSQQPHLSCPENRSNCFPCQPNTATNAGEPCTIILHDALNVSQPANQIDGFDPDFSVSGDTLFNQSNGPHCVGNADESLLAADPNAPFAGSSSPNALDFQFDNWNFEIETFLGR